MVVLNQTAFSFFSHRYLFLKKLKNVTEVFDESHENYEQYQIVSKTLQ